MGLLNPGYEDSGEYGTEVRVFRVDGTPVDTIRGARTTRLSTWGIWFVWDDGWAQPESRYAPHAGRVLDGLTGWLMFSFYRKHHGGLWQHVDAEPGKRYRFTVNNHAWSSTDDVATTSDGAPGLTSSYGMP